jgi:hypothetical protein
MKNLSIAYNLAKRNKMSKGGQVKPDVSVGEMEIESHPSKSEAISKAERPDDMKTIVEAILKDRRMAQGGMVEESGDGVESVFEPHDAFNEHGQEGNLKENYASDLSDETKDEGIVGQILSDRKKKK